jgi:hypothetical protein
MEGSRSAYTVLVGKIKGRRPLGRPRRRWEDNIKCILEKWDGARNGSIWLRIGCDNEPSGSIKCGEFLEKLRTW